MKPKKQKPIPEKIIETQIKLYLRSQGWIVCKVRSTGRFNAGKLHALPKDELGVSDLLCCDPLGQFHAIEVKNKIGKQSTHQKEFQREVESKAGRYAVLRSLEDAIEYDSALNIIKK